jgi:hypothetical protein
MKSDTLTTVLNFVLVLFAVGGVIFAILTFTRTRELRTLTPQVNQAQMIMRQMNGLIGDLVEYNKTAKSPELTGLLQPFLQPPASKPAAR